jgi:hypothetical protein
MNEDARARLAHYRTHIVRLMHEGGAPLLVAGAVLDAYAALVLESAPKLKTVTM